MTGPRSSHKLLPKDYTDTCGGAEVLSSTTSVAARRRAKGRHAGALALLTLGSAALVFFGTPAYAAGDGTNPNDTGCANASNNPVTEAHVSGPSGLLELRFSWGCLTAWARFTCQQSTRCTNYKLYIHRNNDGREYSVTVTAPASTGNGQQLFTLQLNDGAGSTAKACLVRTDAPVPPICTTSF
jgi:hypothetical protein